jgi:hypothetical protein
MDNELFDETDLNHILEAVVDYKVRLMRMEVNPSGGAEYRRLHISELTRLEGKISRELDGGEG